MKYYSELVNKFFDSVEETEKAEKEYEEKQVEVAKQKEIEAERIKKLKADRGLRAKEVDVAYEKYKELLNTFVKDYGTYHYEIKFPIIDEFINTFFR